MKKIILLLSAILLLVGCGSDDVEKKNIDANRTEESNVTTPPKNTSVDYTIPLKYEYNKDGSATRKLAPLYVNQYKDVQKKLDEKKSDSVEFYSVLSRYIGDLYRGTDSLGTIPSYAPSGESKSQMVTVTNGQVDYSSYKLKGDIDFNWEVDFRDLKLLSEAILNDVDSFQYDVNGDGKVDTADVVDVVSRFGNEIKYFDFYTTDGTKLSIDTRTTDDEKIFAYGGSETQIMVVAKDRNHASAYENGLSDIGDVWYKQDGWELEDEIPKLDNPKLSKTTVVDNWEFDDRSKASMNEYVQENPYLVGWKFFLSYQGFYAHGHTDKEIVSIPLTAEPLTEYLHLMETEIMKHFSKTTMNHPFIKKTHNATNYSSQVGALIGKNYSKMQAVYIESTYSITSGSTKIPSFMIKHFYLWDMSIYYSPKSYMLVGELIRDDGREAKGTVTAGRIGPDQEDVLTGEIEDDYFTVVDASFGTYTIDYRDECSCSTSLGEYVFEEESPKYPEFNIKNNKVKVKLQLLDKDENPMGSKVVKIVAKACVNSGDDEKSFASTTDYKGYVDFSDVPIGDYIVYADGKENSTIHFCEAYDGKLSSEQLWDIDLKFDAHPNAGESTDIYYDAQEKWHWKKVKFATVNDTVYSGATAEELYNSGAFYFPYVERGVKILGHTKPYREHGIEMTYTNEGKYCMDDIQKLISDYLVKTMGHNVEELADALDTRYGVTDLVENCTMRLGSEASGGAGAIYMGLSSSNVDNLLKHKAFTFQESRGWGNMKGTSTITIEFRPAK